MRQLLRKLLGRLPIGWLQLTHSKTRMAAAIAGVAFANILVFMQLGFLGALVSGIRIPYDQLNGQILVSGSDANTLSDGSPLPRQRLFQSLAVPGVQSATPIFIGTIDWKQSDGTIRSLITFGIDPSVKTFNTAQINGALDQIMLSDRALIDRKTRNIDRDTLDSIHHTSPLSFETRNRTLTVNDTFEMGGGFSADGYFIVSDQTFLKLFPQRSSAAPNHILIGLEPDAAPQTVATHLRQLLPDYDTQVRTMDEAVAKDQAFQTTQKPVGLIFGFGVVIGIFVGVIIVYQILSTDVADHIREYATFKAIGYPNKFFTGVIFEEAVALAVLGFIPGLLISWALYGAVRSVAELPVAMPLDRAVYVLIGTLVACALSGLMAARRLVRANPADLF